MNSELPPSCDLSVVIGAAHPGPDFDRLLAALLPQLADIRGELVVVDGTPDGFPTPERECVRVVHLHEPGADVFRLRALGVAAATGWVVAFTEDHCIPADGWCLGILDAHRRFGDKAAISGAAVNGTVDTLWDRASFLLTFAPVLVPLGQTLTRVPPPANVSIKREALADYPDIGTGFLEFELFPHLFAAGHVGLASDVQVAHWQKNTAGWFVTHHFHNGRTTGGLVARGGGLASYARRAWASVALVPRHVIHTAREVWKRPAHRRGDLPAVPFVGVLIAAHAVGQIVGMLRGPGLSPAELD